MTIPYIYCIGISIGAQFELNFLCRISQQQKKTNLSFLLADFLEAGRNRILISCFSDDAQTLM